jgi:aspartate-semialdehyde dehydrogenase
LRLSYLKLVLSYESQKILHKDIKISATCVRVPVLRSHSESVSVTFDEDIDVDLDKIKNALSEFENIELLDDLESGVYPMPIISTDTDITYVGRVRKDIYQDNIVHFWVVADQVRVGAATNAVRIAQKFIKLED